MTARTPQSGRIYGTPARLTEPAPEWAANAGAITAGRRGELRTAAILDRHARQHHGVAVFHDLRIPTPGTRANIDHILIAGNTITILETKTWKAGRYKTDRGGTTRRDGDKFDEADKRTLPMAVEAFTRLLDRYHPTGRLVLPPLFVIWPTPDTGAIRTRGLRLPANARPIVGAQLALHPARYLPNAPANSALEALIAQMVRSATSR